MRTRVLRRLRLKEVGIYTHIIIVVLLGLCNTPSLFYQVHLKDHVLVKTYLLFVTKTRKSKVLIDSIMCVSLLTGFIKRLTRRVDDGPIDNDVGRILSKTTKDIKSGSTHVPLS